MVTDARSAAPRPQLWRITDRRSFQALRRSRARARSGCCSVTWLPASDPTAPPRLGFAVGRAAGPAVVRNRIRRRLRAAARDLRVAGRLPAGTYLVAAGAEAAQVPWPDLVAALGDAVQAATATAGATRPGAVGP